MNIAIIAAMQKELDLLRPLLADAVEFCTTDYACRGWRGRIGRHRVNIVKCGIGKVNAALRTQSLLRAATPDVVINTGVAGGTGAAGILDTVVGTTTAYHDVWCGPGTKEGEAAGCPPRFEADPRLASLPCLNERPGLRRGLICTGDRFISTVTEVKRILGLYPDALAVDMESAAIAQTCMMARVPFISIRVLSDTPGSADNIGQYEDFWNSAPAHTFELTRMMLSQLPEAF